MLDVEGKAWLLGQVAEFEKVLDRGTTKATELTAEIADLEDKIPAYQSAVAELLTAAAGIVDLPAKAVVLAEAARLDAEADEDVVTLASRQATLMALDDRLEAAGIAIGLLTAAAA